MRRDRVAGVRGVGGPGRGRPGPLGRPGRLRRPARPALDHRRPPASTAGQRAAMGVVCAGCPVLARCQDAADRLRATAGFWAGTPRDAAVLEPAHEPAPVRCGGVGAASEQARDSSCWRSRVGAGRDHLARCHCRCQRCWGWCGVISEAGVIVTADMAVALAESAGVCVRPLLRKVTDRATGTVTSVPIPCGSTRDSRCPACAAKAKRLRMHQCREGWHLTDDPTAETVPDDVDEPDDLDEDQADDDDSDDGAGVAAEPSDVARRARSTRRRRDAAGPASCRHGRPHHRARRSPTRAPAGSSGRRCSSPSPCRPTGGSSPAGVSRSTRPATTTVAPRWMRCTSRRSWTGGCRTCAAAPGTRCSTSPPSNHRNASPRTCTPRSAARSPAPPSRPSPARPT